MKFKFIFSAIFLCLLLLLYFSPYVFNKHKPIISKVLVVEAWLSPGDLEIMPSLINFDKIDTIFVSGVKQKYSSANFELSSFPLQLYSNACLKIVPDSNWVNIEINAKGTEFKKRLPLLTITQNSFIIKNIQVSKENQDYKFQIFSNSQPIYIYYANDASGENEDRNLFINTITVNGKSLDKIAILPDYKVNFDHNSNYPFMSNAEKTANYLRILHPNCTVISVDTFHSINKTMVAAEKLSIVLKKKVPANFNVVSVHGHSMRSYLAYKKNFPETQIGIISLDNRKFRKQKKWYKKLYYIADEYVSIVVTAFFCL